jgi:hypothetical protein
MPRRSRRNVPLLAASQYMEEWIKKAAAEENINKDHAEFERSRRKFAVRAFDAAGRRAARERD